MGRHDNYKFCFQCRQRSKRRYNSVSKSVIYETKGRAREYCELAINLYSGCWHNCLYCYGPDVTHQERERFGRDIKSRVTPGDIQVSAASRKGEERPVLMCFVTDPYQPLEAEIRLTLSAMEILHDYGLRFAILTKAGCLARRDWNMYREGDSFGTTLTFFDRLKSGYWEPRASLPEERIQNLMLARDYGIPTWVSLEPVIDPFESLAIIHGTADFVDHYKVGRLNYRPEAAKINYAQFAEAAISALRKHRKGFQIKRDLGAFIGYPEGLREGRQLP